MIESITIKKVATYSETGIQINDLKKVNFISGANGSGKTTISNYLQYSTVPKFGNCTVTWENAIEIKTLVYNKVFLERNFGKVIERESMADEALKSVSKKIKKSK